MGIGHGVAVGRGVGVGRGVAVGGIGALQKYSAEYGGVVLAFLYSRIWSGLGQSIPLNSWLIHCCHVGVAVGDASAMAAWTVAGMSGVGVGSGVSVGSRVGVGSGVGLGNSVWRTARILASISRSLLTRASTVASMFGVMVGGSCFAVGGGEEQATMAIKTNVENRAMTRGVVFIVCWLS